MASIEEIKNMSLDEIDHLAVEEFPDKEDVSDAELADIAVEKKNKIREKQTQKAEGADPGVHFNLDFKTYSAPEKVHWVNVDIFISIPEKQNTRSLSGTKVSKEEFQHHVSFTMDANNGDKNNPVRHNELDLSEPYKILVPFVDVNWFEKKHHEMDIHYRLEFKYNEIDVVAHTAEGVLKASAVHEGPFAIETDKSNLPSYMPWNQQVGDLHFDEVIYTEHGVWWRMHYVGDMPRPTYLVGEYNSNTNFCPYPSAHGNYKVDHYESCFLPYPRLKNSTYPRQRCSIFVGNGHERRILTPPVDFDVHKGDWKIVGTFLSGSGHASNHTPSNNKLPVSTTPATGSAPRAAESIEEQSPTSAPEPVENGFLAGIIAWFKSLFS